MNIREHLPLVEAPESIWSAIEAAAERQRRLQRPMFLAAAAAFLLAAAGLYWFGFSQRGWIETSASTRTTLRIGDIGSIDVGPRTRLRVVTDRPDQHRLALVHGAIYARITAPPRLFLVDTKSGTATDLGCEYALQMDDTGSGIVRVVRGWVSFEWKGLESLVPAGAICRIRAHEGPGMPYFDDASPEFIQAAERGATDALLTSARPRDTLTLWHLLSRVPPSGRAGVFDRIARLTPLPSAISRERALALDPEILTALKDELAWKW